MKISHYLLLTAPLALAGVAVAYPKAWPAVVGLLMVAHVVAVFTHKPGAVKLIEELQADAAKVKE